MKILMLSTRMGIGGAESHIYTLSRELVRLGHTVAVASSGGIYEKLLEREGIAHFSLPLDKKDARSLSRSYLGLAKIIREFSPDIVHSHSRISSLVAYRLSRERDSHIRLITTAHMPFSLSPPYKAATKWGERCIAVSRDVKKYLTDNYPIREEQIDVIENGVVIPDTDELSLVRTMTRAVLGIERDATVFSSVSRSSESRAATALFLCENAAELLREREYLLLCISGKAGGERDQTKRLRRLAREANRRLGRRAVILVEGACDVSAYLSASDVFIGVSRAAAEAMAHSLPVIIAGNEGVGGIFTPERALPLTDTNLTARGMSGDLSLILPAIDSLRNKSVRDEISRRSAQYAKEHLCAHDMAKKTEAVYKRLAKKKILLVGYYGAQNTGDDAALDILRGALAEKYEVYNIVRTPLECSERCILRTDIKRIDEVMRGAAAVIFGTGNLLQDKTSRRSLAFWAMLFDMAKKRADRVVLFSLGIGPLCSDYAKNTARRLLERADYVSLREPTSLSAARILTENTRTLLRSSDIVLLTKKAEYKRKAEIKRGRRGYYLLFPRADQARSDTEAVRGFISLAARQGLYPVIIPMDKRRDLSICAHIADGRWSVCSDVGASEILDLADGARFAVSARLHGTVLCAMASLPILSSDCDGRLGAFSLYSGAGVTLRSGEYDAHALFAGVLDAIAERSQKPYNEKIKILTRRAERDLGRLCEYLDMKNTNEES
ncbi:MAG: glycosyltransferase [Clostridia bacterium]|nr:glycosyltransferase [Clostridia bacterium]